MLGWWINGVAGAALSSEDRGLHYGDGLFETMRVTASGGLRLLERHLERLELGCARLGLVAPRRALLAAELHAAAAIPRAGVVKLILTRGVGGRGYRPPADAIPTRFVAAYEAPDPPDEWIRDGIEVRTCDTRLAFQPRLAGLKHLNRLEQVCARSEWSGLVPQEGLMLDMDGRVVCATSSNLFVIRRDEWLTPGVDRCGVAGTMRAALLAAAAEAGVRCRAAELYPDDLAGADELFLTNAVHGAWPVRSLDGVPVSTGPAVRLAQEWIRGWS